MTDPVESESSSQLGTGPTRSRTPGRRAILAVLGALTVLALAASLIQSTAARAPLPVPDVAPPGDAIDAAWHCAEGTAGANGRADETLLIANLDDASAQVTVSVAIAGQRTERTVTVEGKQQRRVKVSDIASGTEPGVTVYSRGGRITVEHQLVGANDIAVGPCARESSSSWYFAAGTTVRGAFEWLALYNPYPEGATVDVEVYTKELSGDASVDRPSERINSINVPGYTRVSLPVHERIGRYSATAIAVRARFGRIVAERSLVFDNVDGRSGLALSLGAPTLATAQTLAGGRAGEGRSEIVAVANPGATPASVRLSYVLEGNLSIEPFELVVQPRTVAVVDLPNAPKDRYRAVRVESSTPVVAELRASSAKPQKAVGIATMMADPVPATRVTFLAARVAANSMDHFIMVNPGRRTTSVTVRSLDDTFSPASFEIGPFGMVEFAAGDVGAQVNTAIEIASAEPIVVAHDADTPGITMSGGIPQ
ncbi:MAG: DUF5719 family protein [Acidimicrobiia bacterium]